MIEIQCIVCPIDFSEFSQHALDCAVAIARRYKSRVIALHVFAEWPAVDVIPSLRTQALQSVSLKDVGREELMRQLQRVVARRPAHDVHIEARLEEAPDVHREILAQADVLKADLIVIGSHGRSGFERILLGSTTEKVLRKATCPVMVVPRRVDDAALARAEYFKRILCPVDFSSSSTGALRYALSLAQELEAQLTALHVVEIPAGLDDAPGFDLTEFRRATESACRTRLRDLIPESVGKSCTVDTIVSEGRASRDILRVAAERNSDLIVMGVHGRGAVDLMVFGSNTHHVIRAASCPVLTILGP
jgi:nucleotide-binding universal stress UspA family protein